jgi:hypothetical protein
MCSLCTVGLRDTVNKMKKYRNAVMVNLWRRQQQNMFKHCVKCPIILSDLNQIWTFLADFHEIS